MCGILERLQQRQRISNIERLFLFGWRSRASLLDAQRSTPGTELPRVPFVRSLRLSLLPSCSTLVVVVPLGKSCCACSHDQICPTKGIIWDNSSHFHNKKNGDQDFIAHPRISNNHQNVPRWWYALGVNIMKKTGKKSSGLRVSYKVDQSGQMGPTSQIMVTMLLGGKYHSR